MFKYRPILVIVVILTIPFLACSSPKPDGEVKKYNQPPTMTIDVNKKYTATIQTEKGDIVVDLFPQKAPKTVNNFVFLAREKFYDGTIFHRVIPGFMAQGGDPIGNGTGGPGYKFEDEISDLKHITGVISMANSGPNTNGSQFFITYAPAHYLDGKHTVFGQVTQGMTVLNKLTSMDPMKNPAIKGDKIITITITESE